LERTETQILFNQLDLTFNGEPVRIKKRSIRRSQEWLQSVLEKDGKPVEALQSAEGKPEQLPAAGYGNLISLICEYADGALTPEQISEGYPEELQAAFDTLLEVSGFFDLMWGKTPRIQQLVRAQRQ
jgi:hypothetical protein